MVGLWSTLQRTLEREGGAGTGRGKELSKNVLSVGVWLQPDPTGSPGGINGTTELVLI